MPNLVEIDQNSAGYSDISIFQDGGRRHLVFLFFYFNGRTLKMAELRCRAKFDPNRSKRGQDMAIFRFSKMAAAAILDFSNFKSLSVGPLKMAELHRRAKFGRNQSFHGRDMAIFLDFSMMAVVRHLRFVMCVFGPPTKGIWWSLSLCKIWLESMQ